MENTEIMKRETIKTTPRVVRGGPKNLKSYMPIPTIPTGDICQR